MFGGLGANGFRFSLFLQNLSFLPVPNARRRFTAAPGSPHTGRNVGACALYGHFCKIDRIGASSRRLLHVIGTYGFI